MTQEELIINWSDKILNHLLKLKEEKYPDLTFWLRKQDSERLRKGFWFQGSHYILVGLVNRGDWQTKTRQVGLSFNFENTDNPTRSEEHTSELQSRENLVCRLLLEKKKEKELIITHI